jgi:hypothetical protein
LGLGYAKVEFDVSGSAGAVQAQGDASGGGFYWQVGIGNQFTPHVGAEIRYQSLKLNNVTGSVEGQTVEGSSTSPSTQISLNLRW